VIEVIDITSDGDGDSEGDDGNVTVVQRFVVLVL